MATQIGPKIGIEGEKEYRQQIQQIIQQTKSLDAAMEKTASEWTKNTSAMTKNQAIARNLADKIELQKEKLTVMNKLLDESAEKFGKNSTATQAWQRTVDTATASLNRMESELKELGGAENFSKLSTSFADFGTKMQNMGQNLTSVGQKMTTSITLPLAAVGAASVKLASDLEEATSKVDVVFGSMSESVKQFADDALNSYGLAEGTAMEMTSTFGAMATSMGLSQKQAASMSMELTALAADMSSFYNVSTEVAQTSLQGVFTGETEALKKFGVVMTQTNLEEFAAKQGKVYSSMSEGEKVMTRYAYVMNATKDAQGDFARTSDGTANSFRIFKESLKELGAAFGQQLLPIITPVIQALTSLIQKMASLPEPIQKFITVILLLVAAIGPLLLIIGSMMSAFGSIVTNAPLIASAFMKIGEAAGVMAAALGMSVPELLAIVAVVAVIAVAAYEIATHWDEISEAAQEMAQKVRNAFNRLMDINTQLKNKVYGIVEGIVESFLSLPGKLAEALSTAIQQIKDAFNQMIKDARESGAHMIEGFVDGIKEKVSKIVDAVKNIANTIKDFLGFSRPDKGPLHEYEEWMPHFMQGLAKGINANKSLVTNAINGLTKEMAIPLDANASMNMALAGADGSTAGVFGGFTMNVSVDHINDLNDLLRIQQQAQQMYRMGAR